MILYNTKYFVIKDLIGLDKMPLMLVVIYEIGEKDDQIGDQEPNRALDGIIVLRLIIISAGFLVNRGILFDLIRICRGYHS